jgi:NADH-quinone oxidoreductase subunit N
MNQLVDVGALLRTLTPELTLCAGALVMLMATVWKPQGTAAAAAEGAERTAMVTRLGMLLTVIVAGICIAMWINGVPGSADQRIAGDSFRWTIDLVVLLGTLLSLVLLDADHRRNGAYSPEIPVLIILAASGMMILAAARDLMFVFLGVELMSIAAYVLAGSNRRSARSAEAGMKYFLLGAFSTGFLLYGMALVYGATGSTRLVDIGQSAAGQPLMSALMVVGLALLLVGFAFKVAAVPFHLWTPDVYDGAPLPVTAFMAAAVKTAAFASFARVLIEAFGAFGERWHPVLWWVAAATMVIGNVMALTQKNLVRMLAYSSIAHAGYLLIALVVNSEAGLSALAFYVVAYTLATMGAFGVLITVNGGKATAPTMDDVAGLWHVRPGLAVSMTVFLLAFMGFPLLGGIGFFAKWYLLQAMLDAGAPQVVLAVILVLTSVVSAGYYLAVVTAMFMRPRPDGKAIPSGTPAAHALITFAVVAILVLGVYPTPVIGVARRASASLVQAMAAPPVNVARLGSATDSTTR